MVEIFNHPGEEESEFLRLYRENVERVYRFHLARTGDIGEAEKFTVQTFLTAKTWFSQKAQIEAAGISWLFRIACNSEDIHPSGLTIIETAQGGSGGEKPQTPLEMQAAQIADQLSLLSDEQRTALELHFFAGLGLEETAAVVGRSKGRVNRWIQEGFISWLTLERPAEKTATREARERLGSELKEFAGTIHVGVDFTTALEAELRKPNQKASPQVTAGKKLPWKVKRRAPLLTSRGMLVLAIILLSAGLVLSFAPAQPEIPGGIAAETNSNSGGAPSSRMGDGWSTGLLVLPGPSECATWLEQLSDQLPVIISHEEFTPLNLPGIPRAEGRGLGCRLIANGTSEHTREFRRAVVEIENRLSGLGYRLYLGDRREAEAGNSRVERQPQSLRLIYRHPQGWAIINLQWVPEERWHDFSQPAPTPIPGNPIARRPVLTVELSADAVRSTLARFFNAWQNGDAEVNAYLAADLQASIPNLRALDRLAGIQRLLLREVNFDWQLLENGRDYARVQVEVEAIPRVQIQPAGKASLQMTLVRSESGWQVAEIAQEMVFPPTQDIALAADSEGQLFAIGVAR